MPPDFQRDVYCVLGLPFDALTVADAQAALLRSARDRTRCFFSTPNLNFVVGCLDDAAFRTSVLQSNLSLADGWPIISLARLIGVPLPERVAGSSLFERLSASVAAPKLKVYFFGGPDGAASAASTRLNESSPGVRCVGFDSPGFGTVEQMSEPSRLAQLNAADADFLVVALGAKKGQAWIQHNLAQIGAPIVSHLGAVVNFAAGTVTRAPLLVQRLHLEWLWRIKEEPSLWRRYAGDGWALLRLAITRVFPLAIQVKMDRPSAASLANARVTAESGTNQTVVRLSGSWAHSNLQPLRDVLAANTKSSRPVSVDLSNVSHLDSSALGLLTLLHGWNVAQGATTTVTGASGPVRRIFHLACAAYLLQNPPPMAR